MRMSKKPDAGANAPFFILGCVRSGTTMLRDVLRRHPNLAAPEETHFFRWAEPFGSEVYTRSLLNNPVLKRHRDMDGITEAEFEKMLADAASRADLYRAYMALYIQRKKPGARRWFDKTPQNVYGAAMIAASMPRARFIHIVRDPVNVVASLRIGRVMKVDRLIGAVNYWREAIDTMGVLKRAYPGRVHELRYEDLVRDPQPHIQAILEFLGESWNADWFADFAFRESDHAEEQVLSEAEVQRIQRLCVTGRRRHGYEARPDGEAGGDA